MSKKYIVETVIRCYFEVDAEDDMEAKCAVLGLPDEYLAEKFAYIVHTKGIEVTNIEEEE